MSFSRSFADIAKGEFALYRIEIRQPNAKIRSCFIRLRRIIRLGENTCMLTYFIM